MYFAAAVLLTGALLVMALCAAEAEDTCHVGRSAKQGSSESQIDVSWRALLAAVRSAGGAVYDDYAEEGESALVSESAAVSYVQATFDNRLLNVIRATDGTRTARLVFGTIASAESQLLYCDVSAQAAAASELQRYAAGVSAATSGGFDGRSSGALASIAAVAWIDACCEHLRLYNRSNGNALHEAANHYDTASGGSDGGRKPQELIALHRPRRSYLTLVYPGTLWCGRGKSASNYEQLGENWMADSCCRTHDFCPLSIASLSRAFNYFNFRPYVVSHCDCDMRFRKCLKRAALKYADAPSQTVGGLFFSTLGVPCFVLEEQQTCAERTWWGTCARYDRVLTARMRDPNGFG